MDRWTLDDRIRARRQPGLPRVARAETAVPWAVLELKSPAPDPSVPPALQSVCVFQSFSKYGILLRALLDEPDALSKFAPT
jgi:hypothetical protein